MSSIHEQRTVYNRLKEICPDKDTTIMTFEELIKDCNVAFKIIGYDPKNLGKSVREHIENRHPVLYQFIYDVWETDIYGVWENDD